MSKVLWKTLIKELKSETGCSVDDFTKAMYKAQRVVDSHKENNFKKVG